MKIFPAILILGITGCSNSLYKPVEVSFSQEWEQRKVGLNESLRSDQDQDGVIDYWDQCLNTPPQIKVSIHGCPLDMNGNGLPDFQETTFVGVSQGDDNASLLIANSAEAPIIRSEPMSSNQHSFMYVSRLNSFELESDRISTPMRAVLAELVVRFNEDETVRAVELTGHTDDRGNATYNFALALKRAETIATYFRSQLRNDIQVMVRGMGELEPIADNATDEGRVLNRRVEVHALYKK